MVPPAGTDSAEPAEPIGLDHLTSCCAISNIMLDSFHRESPERNEELMDMYINLVTALVNLAVAIILLAQTRKPKGKKPKR